MYFNLIIVNFENLERSGALRHIVRINLQMIWLAFLHSYLYFPRLKNVLIGERKLAFNWTSLQDILQTSSNYV